MPRKVRSIHTWDYQKWQTTPNLEVAGETIKPHTFILESSRSKVEYRHAYSYKEMLLVLSHERVFEIFHAESKKQIALPDSSTTSLEDTVRGFVKIATYTDWGALVNRKDEAEMAEALTFLIQTYETDMGAYWDYSLFGRRFAEVMTRALRASEAISKSAL